MNIPGYCGLDNWIKRMGYAQGDVNYQEVNEL